MSPEWYNFHEDGGETIVTGHDAPEGTRRELTPEEARALLDRQARRHLGMSGEEFVRRYRAGEFAEVDTPDVARVFMLLPLAV